MHSDSVSVSSETIPQLSLAVRARELLCVRAVLTLIPQPLHKAPFPYRLGVFVDDAAGKDLTPYTFETSQDDIDANALLRRTEIVPGVCECLARTWRNGPVDARDVLYANAVLAVVQRTQTAPNTVDGRGALVLKHKDGSFRIRPIHARIRNLAYAVEAVFLKLKSAREASVFLTHLETSPQNLQHQEHPRSIQPRLYERTPFHSPLEISKGAEIGADIRVPSPQRPMSPGALEALQAVAAMEMHDSMGVAHGSDSATMTPRSGTKRRRLPENDSFSSDFGDTGADLLVRSPDKPFVERLL